MPAGADLGRVLCTNRREPPPFDPGHLLGCHRRRVSDRVVFEHLVAALVHGSGYERIASPGCSDRTTAASRGRHHEALEELSAAEHLNRSWRDRRRWRAR